MNRQEKKKNLRSEPGRLHAYLGVSLRGRLAFNGRVKYGAEAIACQLAGEKLSDPCLIVSLWRQALSDTQGALRPSIAGFPPALSPFVRIALAVRALRVDERRWPLRAGTMEGVLCITSGSLRAPSRSGRSESLDVMAAFVDVSQPGNPWFSFGLSFGAIGVRVMRGNLVDGLVVWDGNRGAEELHKMLSWRVPEREFAGINQQELQRQVHRHAGHVLRREARRLLRLSQRLLAERQQQEGVEDVVEGG